MKGSTGTVQLARAALQCPCHLCAFFRSSEQEYRILVPFVKDGLQLGDKSVHILDDSHLEERRRRLQEMGVDLSAAERSGQLEIRTWGQAYLRHGRFNQDAMLSFLEEAMASGKRQGSVRTRLWANMDWAFDLPNLRDIAEYETRLERLMAQFDGILIFTYDVTRFGAAVVVHALETHRFSIVGSILQENPFRIEPLEYLEVLRRRAGGVD
jgi:hypothetical protein